MSNSDKAPEIKTLESLASEVGFMLWSDLDVREIRSETFPNGIPKPLVSVPVNIGHKYDLATELLERVKTTQNPDEVIRTLRALQPARLILEACDAWEKEIDIKPSRADGRLKFLTHLITEIAKRIMELPLEKTDDGKGIKTPVHDAILRVVK